MLSFSHLIPQNYKSQSQKIRVASENWFLINGYCVECIFNLNQFENNKPVADYYCDKCKEQYELKSKNGNFGKKLADGEYNTMIRRINSNENPNLIALSYNKNYEVENIVAIPKFFFTEKVIEKRKSLSETARRSGWTGCNILFSEIPDIGKIFMVQDGVERDRKIVNREWHYSKSFKTKDLKKRGWLFEVLKIVEKQKDNFTIDDIYKYESELKNQFPDNNNIKAKIRQQLQILRDKGYIKFLEKGKYKRV